MKASKNARTRSRADLRNVIQAICPNTLWHQIEGRYKLLQLVVNIV